MPYISIPYQRMHFEIHRMSVWLAQGQLEAAQRWAEAQADSLAAHLDALNPLDTVPLTVAQIWITQGRAAEAVSMLTHIETRCEQQGYGQLALQATVLRALGLQTQGNLSEALAALERALTLAEPEGYVRIFVDEGPRMAALLREAHPRSLAPAYVARLLAAFPGAEGERVKAEEPLTSFQPSPGLQPLVEPLSNRELEILYLLAQDLTNLEIAQQIYISAHTVKVHTRNIYGKLCVNSRQEAVSKAGALGLLS